MSKILPIFLPFLGCSNRCIFCDQISITGVSQPQDYKLDIEEQYNIYSKYSNSFDEIAFYGGNFGAISDEIRHHCYEFAHTHNFTKIRYSTRVDTISDGLLDEAKKNNVSNIELGVQSLDDNVLELNERPYTSKDVLSTIDKVSSVTNCGVQMMIGMYAEKEYSIILDSLVLAKKPIKTVRLYSTLVFKDTKLNKLYQSGDYRLISINESVVLTALASMIFISNNIHVIRMSLPNNSNSNNNIIAGNHHEAYGDIVKTLLILLYLDIGFDIRGKAEDIYRFAGYKGIAKKSYLKQFIIDETASYISFEDIVKKVYNWGIGFEDSFRRVKIKADNLAKSIEY